jgi:cytochrome c2
MLALPALAGGWAVISLDSLPGEIVAGQPITIGFTVRQHGRTPLSGLNPNIRLAHLDSNEKLTVYAMDEGEIGHYSATFSLPESGRWQWSIQAFSMDQPMPELSVVAEPAQLSTSQNANPRTNLDITKLDFYPLIIGLLGMLAAGIGLVYALRRRSRWAMAAIVVGLLVSVAGFARAGIAVASPRIPDANQPVYQPKSVDAVEEGEALFIAKGCLSCHINSRVDARYTVFSTEIGPNLSQYRTSPEYMHLWLSDPAAVKPETEMLDLGLSDSEIEALTAFLLQDSRQ